MAKKLVLAEKPSVARDIARVLKCTKKGNGYLEGNDYIVTWALGHLVGLADPEAYDDRYKTWSMESLPMLPKQMKLVVLKGGGKQFSSVKEQMLRKDVTEIIIATDAGREGELVARWIIEKAKVNKPMKRLWISSVTDKAILEGFKSLKPAKDYENLFEAAVCRAEGDWLVGLNVTRALTCKYNAQLSAGRVQSATLAMIVTREEEIKNFKAEDYFNIKVKVPNFSLMWQGTKGPNIWNQDEAKKLQVQLEGKALQVVKVDESHKKAYAPGLYDLTELQRDANRLYGMSPKETLNVMQRLYENYKILTYPRTDSRYISQDIVSTLKDRLQAVNVGNFRPAVQAILKNGIKAGKHFVDNTKVSDHHAIIPTEESVMIAKLSNDERKIYELVVKRFLSVMLPPYEYKQTTIEAKSGEETFVAKGKVMINQGFKMVYDKGEEDSEETENGEVSLPEVKVGDSLKVVNVECNKLQTKPPARFTEATLLSAMESPHKYVKVSKEAAKTLGETGGIGTVATRADIIEKLYNMFYVEKNGNSVVPTSKGKQLIELVPEELKTPLLTAKWERELELISKGKQNPKDFIARMRKYSSELVDTVKESTDQFKHDNVVGKRCPDCGKNLLEVKGKHGKMYVCQDRACGYRENVSKFTNARCPECHKRLELRGQGDGQIYVCTTCTFREKASTFNNRFKDKQGKGDKKSVQKYMKQQQKEDEGNFAFADLFANLNKK
ncbi:MAG: DNA topoisomerase III [Niameybacter sp.]|uniref:DNA topoisomerase III n=1 Tax=Niameybacter sp. TaxID=2033640 RepID=UPI002FC6BB13